MEGLRTTSRLVEAVVASGALRDDPLVLVDVGCSLGIDAGWRCFGDDFRAFGFDPNLDEIERLRASETHPHINYEAGWVGLPPGHPFLKERGDRAYFGRNPLERMSARAAQHHLAVESAGDLAEQNRWRDARLADPSRRIVLSEYLRATGVPAIDFVKIDVDGEDLEILVSLERLLEEAPVLGIGIEVSFYGSERPTDNTFHNTDRFLKERGFELFGLTVRHYSTAALPAQFVNALPAQTVSGRVAQGDALYFRDLVNPEHRPGLEKLRATQLLKLACVLDLCELGDCAAELLVETRERLEKIVDVEQLLDLLVPEPWSGALSYRSYVADFYAGELSFQGASRLTRAVSVGWDAVEGSGSATVVVHDDSLEITTLPEPWSYAALIPLPDAEDQPLAVRVTITVHEGRVGLGLLRSIDDIAVEQAVEAGDEKTIDLPVLSRADTWGLVTRNHGLPGPSRCTITDVALVVPG